jgi:hypothetical protein
VWELKSELKGKRKIRGSKSFANPFLCFAICWVFFGGEKEINCWRSSLRSSEILISRRKVVVVLTLPHAATTRWQFDVASLTKHDLSMVVELKLIFGVFVCDDAMQKCHFSFAFYGQKLDWILAWQGFWW